MQKKLLKKNLISFSKNNLRKIPASVGVYVFWDESKNPLYVGKSVNLRSRISSYFSNNLHTKTEKLVINSKFLTFIEVPSEIDSLLLEAELVRNLKTFYNIQLKDDKHPLYIAITDEKYPRVLKLRKSSLKEHNLTSIYGPFPSGESVNSTLRLIRNIFPYSQHLPASKVCFYKQLGLCSPCPSEIEKLKGKEKSQYLLQYHKNIKNVKRFLDREVTVLQKQLIKEMKKHANELNFEEAKMLREQLSKIEYVTRPILQPSEFLENPNLKYDIIEHELKSLKDFLNNCGIKSGNLTRIECFDVAHISGSWTTASMVTFIKGEPDKSKYRHFRIRQSKGNSDYDSMKEVAKRRQKNFEKWGIPDIIIVDGGKAQVSAFLSAMNSDKVNIVGIAKRFEKLVVPVDSEENTSYKMFTIENQQALNLIQRIRDESHRFARRYHKLLLRRALVAKRN